MNLCCSKKNLIVKLDDREGGSLAGECHRGMIVEAKGSRGATFPSVYPIEEPKVPRLI
jgi:hypothetical protein